MPKAASPVKRKPSTRKLTSTTSAGIVSGTLPDNSSYATAEQVDPDKPLTDKQRQFVKEWASGESITTASVRAGYETATFGYRMVRMPNILKAYEEEKRLWQEACKITRVNVIDMMQEAYDMAKLTSEPHAMVSAAKEIGKILGYYEPVKRKVEINFTGNARLDQMNSLSNEELAKLVAEAPDAVGKIVEEVLDEQAAEEDEDDES